MCVLYGLQYSYIQIEWAAKYYLVPQFAAVVDSVGTMSPMVKLRHMYQICHPAFGFLAAVF